MKVISCTQAIRMASPNSPAEPEADAVWLSSMSDSAWHTLIDFHNWSHWLPGVDEVQPTDQVSPSRGTRLRLGGDRICTIVRWDPPSGLHFTIESKRREMAYGFTLQASAAEAQLVISLELECEIGLMLWPLTSLRRWRLRRQASRTLASLSARLRPLGS